MMKPKGFWTQETIIAELAPIVQTIGTFPTSTQLSEMGRTDLTNIISSTGGMNKYRKIMGFDILKRAANHWNNWEKFEQEIRENFGDMLDAGVFPSRNQLRSAFPGIARAISGFGGISEVARKMNCKQTFYIEAPDGHLLNSKYELVFDMYLCRQGLSHSVNGVIDRSRKFRYDFRVGDVFVEIWGLTGQSKYDNIKREKKNFYNYLGAEIIEIEGSVFENKLENVYIKLHNIMGGIASIPKFFPIEEENIIYKNTGFWTFTNTLNSLCSWIDKTGKFPSYDDLRLAGMSGLHAAICKHGGLYYFRNLLNMRKKYQRV